MQFRLDLSCLLEQDSLLLGKQTYVFHVMLFGHHVFLERGTNSGNLLEEETGETRHNEKKSDNLKELVNSS